MYKFHLLIYKLQKTPWRTRAERGKYMKREIPQEELIIKRNRRKRGWRRFVMAMACVVVFFTTYALILPAITMEHSCGLEEHAHGTECYEGEVLVCVTEEHRHDIHCEGTKETEAAQTEDTQPETKVMEAMYFTS
jgi:hypothetical protein